MWSKRMVNLNPEKRRRILEAACKEFSKGSYSFMRISRFIKEASISRASFYLYFNDKKDLFCYVLQELGAEKREDFLKCLKAEQGNYYQAAIRSMVQMERNGRLESYIDMCRKIVLESECRDLALSVRQEFYNSGKARQFVLTCFSERDACRYPELDESQFAYAVGLGTDIMFKTFMMYALGYSDIGRLKETMESQLQIVEKALQRKTA